MKIMILSIFLFLSFSNAEARDFLRCPFSLSADYEDLEGNKFNSVADGRIRISSDGVFCVIDMPELGNKYPCQVKDWNRTSFGILVPRGEIVKMYKSLLRTVNPWPQFALERFDLLIKQMRFQSVGNYPGYDPVHSQQLHDNNKADSVHVEVNGGAGWEIY